MTIDLLDPALWIGSIVGFLVTEAAASAWVRCHAKISAYRAKRRSASEQR